jgi:IS30 family transposase
MTYRQITLPERYRMQVLRGLGLGFAAIAREMGRHRSTILRELRRNRRHAFGYDPYGAQCRTETRRSWSRRNRRIAPADWAFILDQLRAGWSPEQIAGRLRRQARLRICHGTIYNYLWADRQAGGELYRHLRRGGRRRRRYGSGPARPGTRQLGRSITTRPTHIEARRQVGHWEIDTMVGKGRACLLTLVERKTGYTLIGWLPDRTATAFTAGTIRLIRTQRHRVRTITADNGTECTGFRAIEAATATHFYFALPHHAWERGTNENTNGLIRQYAPKGQSLMRLTPRDCAVIAHVLNTRPRKRLDYQTPEECYDP